MFYSLSLALLLALQAHGHALITPALQGGSSRGDVTRPSTASPCGAGVDIASLIDTAQAVPITNGNIDATITNFNAGTDGSRFVTAQIDPTGTGKSFQDATVTTNGDKNPTDTGSQPLVVQVPAGVTASGGANGNTMLVAFKTLGGFGNCIAVTSGAAGTTNTTSTGTSTTTSTGNSTTTTGTGAGTTTGKGKGRKHRQAAGAGAGGAAAGRKNKGAAQAPAAGAPAAEAPAAGAPAAGAPAQAPAAGDPGFAAPQGAQQTKARLQRNKLRRAILAGRY